jgi:Ca2+/Na+ antiporter
MFPLEFFHFRSGVVLIDLIGALLIVGYVVAGAVALIRGRGVTSARLLAAEGAIWGLSFKVAGSLLKTIELRDWNQIAMFCTVLTLRILLKRLFTWEEQQLRVRVRIGRPAESGNLDLS